MATKKDETRYSASPTGEKYPIPGEQDYGKELKRIESLVNKARKEKKEIVVVMGLGFVGAVMAAIVADTKDKKRENQQIRYWLSASQRKELLEDPDDQ